MSGVRAPDLAAREAIPVAVIGRAGPGGEGRGGHHVGAIVVEVGDGGGVVAEVGVGSAGSGAGPGVLQAAVDLVAVGVETLRNTFGKGLYLTTTRDLGYCSDVSLHMCIQKWGNTKISSVSYSYEPYRDEKKSLQNIFKQDPGRAGQSS